MSLMVWLPLNGDLKNQGLANVAGSQLGTINWPAGKIGKALYAGNGNQVENGVSYNSNLVSILGSEFSAAIWVYPKGNHVHYNGTFLSSGNWNNQCWSFGVSQDNTQVDVFGAGYNHYITCSVPVNTWTHLVCTHKNGITKLYKNGIYVGQLSGEANALTSDASNFCVGRETYASGYFSFNGYINDVRLYNHCLSAKEVKEISKGLVLHYKLTGNGQENLLKNTNFDSRYTSGTTSQHTSLLASDWDGYNSGVGNATTVYHAHLTQLDGQYVYRYVRNSSNSWLGIQQQIKDKTTVGTTYTFSCELYRVSGTNYPNGGHYTKASSSASGNFQTWFELTDFKNAPVGQWIRYSTTMTLPASCYINDGVSFYIYGHTGGNGEFLMRHPKLEVGSKATPWIPSSSDAIYTSLGFNSTTEYDCSGYNHNGTKVKVTVSTDTPRYKTCNAFLGSTVDNTSNTLTGAAYITAGLPLPASSALTVSWWGKIIKYCRGGIFETTGVTSDYVNGTDYSTTAIANWDHTFRVYNGSSYVNLYSNMGIPNSSWQLNTITFDGANVKYYKNGALVSTSALTGTLPAFNGIKIGIGKAGGVYRQIQQHVSDFRIYVTALTADDIKELYQIPIAIDKLGNAFASEFIEDQKPEFEKTGIMENSYIHENEADDSDSLTTFHIGKTKTFANQIIEV